jgi:hypothetical protein
MGSRDTGVAAAIKKVSMSAVSRHQQNEFQHGLATFWSQKTPWFCNRPTFKTYISNKTLESFHGIFRQGPGLESTKFTTWIPGWRQFSFSFFAMESNHNQQKTTNFCGLSKRNHG